METVQLDQCKQQLAEAEQSTARDMLVLCRTLSTRSEEIHTTIVQRQDEIQRLNSELNTTMLNKISLTNTIRSDATSHTNPLTTEGDCGWKQL